MKMIDLGSKPSEVMAVPGGKPRKYYPSFTVNVKDAPALKGMEVDESFLSLCKMRVASERKDDHGHEFSLEIQQMSNPDPGRMTDEELNESINKALNTD